MSVHVPEDLLSRSEDEHAARLAAARRNKAELESFVRGSMARAESLQRGLLPRLGFAVADLMLMEIVTGRLKPKTAKEAADIAKVALDIARRESGEPDSSIVIGTPEQRAAAIAKISELKAIAEQRQLTAGPPVESIPEGSEISEISQRDPDLEYLSPRPSTPGRALVTVRRTTESSNRE